MIEITLMWLASLTLAGWAGWLLGTRHMDERVDEEVERMYRIEPPDRTPRQPTNMAGTPARVRRSKYRTNRMKG